MKALVVIPTYNEKENIEALVPGIFEALPEVHVLVVDDNSPDGTAAVVERLKSAHSQLHLLLREKKQGLGRAYLAGFDWALAHDFEAVVEMDADFSHRIQDLRSILKELSDFDFIIGSRWVEGGKTVNWGALRQLISLGGSAYTRMILGYPIQDWTGGFNAWKAKVLRGIDLPSVESEGYSFQIELKYRAVKKEFSYKEVPIVFEDRRVGQSKMSMKIIVEAFYRVWRLRFLL